MGRAIRLIRRLVWVFVLTVALAGKGEGQSPFTFVQICDPQLGTVVLVTLACLMDGKTDAALRSKALLISQRGSLDSPGAVMLQLMEGKVTQVTASDPSRSLKRLHD